jgi:hypothetical protein
VDVYNVVVEVELVDVYNIDVVDVELVVKDGFVVEDDVVGGVELVDVDNVDVVNVELIVEDNVVSFVELMDVVLVSVGVENEFTFA